MKKGYKRDKYNQHMGFFSYLVFCLCRFAHLGESQHRVDRTEHINLANIISLWVKHVTLRKKKVFPSSIILTHVWWYWWRCVLILPIIIQPFFCFEEPLSICCCLGTNVPSCSHWVLSGEASSCAPLNLDLLDPNLLSLYQLTFLLNTAINQPLQNMSSFPQLHFSDHQHVVWQCATSETQKQHRCVARSRSFSPSLNFTNCSCRG